MTQSITPPPNSEETPADILKEIREVESPRLNSERGWGCICAYPTRLLQYCDRLEAAIAREKRGAKLLRFDLSQSVETVLKIGREFQNKDGFRGAHYDTVKILCDTIEDLNEQLLEQKNPHPLESHP
ncbi:MAG: hypothetical protein J6Q22_11000 [Prevotella sp.]|nr:hypothetical protein [Prevotella sp.]